jgi:ankyrin repeat protein
MQGHANIADLAYSGDVYTISIEVSKGVYIDERDSFQKKYTALMVAAREGDYRLAEWLIEHGANVNAKTRDGHTALMYACHNRYPEIVRLLLKKGADVHLKSVQGHTAWTEIMETEKDAIMQALLDSGAKEEKIK